MQINHLFILFAIAATWWIFCTAASWFIRTRTKNKSVGSPLLAIVFRWLAVVGIIVMLGVDLVRTLIDR
jgi:hypothetical protein